MMASRARFNRAMRPSESLLVALSRYRPREARESLEDFLTELVAYAMRRQPELLVGFLRCVVPPGNFWACVPPQNVTIEPQKRVSIRRPRLGRIDLARLDLVLTERSGAQLVVESKVDAGLSSEQLSKYLDFADSKPDISVVVVAAESQRVAAECRHPRFLGQTMWADVVAGWRRNAAFPGADAVDRWLLAEILALMGDRQMTHWGGDFEDADDQAGRRWVGVRRKMDGALREVVKYLPTWAPVIANLEHQKIPCEISGHVGLLWLAPSAYSPSTASYWYFLGFAFDPPSRWSLALQQDGATELWAAVIVWPTNLEECRKLVGSVAARLHAQHGDSFEFVETGNGGSALVRRCSLRRILEKGSQRDAVVEFFRSSHEVFAGEGVLSELHAIWSQTPGAHGADDKKD
jgi:hypothetical protein